VTVTRTSRNARRHISARAAGPAGQRHPVPPGVGALGPPDQSVGVAPGPSLERSGLSGRVFMDLNANGIRDVGEPAVANAHVLVGSLSARTDSSGAYRVWDLVPFEPVIVSLDSVSLDSPLFVPLFARTSIVRGPIASAVSTSGGRSRRHRGPSRPQRRGSRRRDAHSHGSAQRHPAHLVTFNDGAFYLMGVKPGDYELTVAEQVLDALAVDAEPVRFSLAPTASGIGRSDLEVRLKSRF